MAIQIDVIVVVIDRGDERVSFIPFVGMPIAPCFKIVKSEGMGGSHVFCMRGERRALKLRGYI